MIISLDLHILVAHVATYLQASANMILSHFLGLVFSLELLRSVALPHSESIPALKAA